MKTLTEKRFFEWHEDDVSVTLRNKSGSYGVGQRSVRHLLYTDTVGALCATDYKWVQQEQVMQGKLIVEVTDDISESDRPSDGEQSSRELLRTGCVHRHVRDGE